MSQIGEQFRIRKVRLTMEDGTTFEAQVHRSHFDVSTSRFHLEVSIGVDEVMRANQAPREARP